MIFIYSTMFRKVGIYSLLFLSISFNGFSQDSLQTVVAKNAASDRSYRVVEEVGTRPNIFYQTKVRNKDKAEA